jgi:hypothetical protein
MGIEKVYRTRKKNGRDAVNEERDWGKYKDDNKHQQLLQRIATFTEPYINPLDIERRLRRGECIVTRYSTYHLERSDEP